MGSAWNIASNATVNTTVNDVLIPIAMTASTAVHVGDDLEHQSSRRTDSVKCVYATGTSSSPQPLLTTEFQFAEAEIAGLGKTWSRNVPRATRGKLSMRAVAGTTGEGGTITTLAFPSTQAAR